jgi:hypothetical protein
VSSNAKSDAGGWNNTLPGTCIPLERRFVEKYCNAKGWLRVIKNLELPNHDPDPVPLDFGVIMFFPKPKDAKDYDAILGGGERLNMLKVQSWENFVGVILYSIACSVQTIPKNHLGALTEATQVSKLSVLPSGAMMFAQEMEEGNKKSLKDLLKAVFLGHVEHIAAFYVAIVKRAFDFKNLGGKGRGAEVEMMGPGVSFL